MNDHDRENRAAPALAAAGQEWVWLYDAGDWRRIPSPVDSADGDVHERRVTAGYVRPGRGPFIRLRSGAAGLDLWVRAPQAAGWEQPECIIDVTGTEGVVHTAYAQWLPEALDLMARWAPLIQAGIPAGEAGRR